ncbi:TetR/AcrR family transcriptional regulator C-terminal domain-containing protein [Actinomadura barringtoniae]|uniref:TetR/AcrR family transcriptional regulator C-terminal domain-containing protein n=1 Tax=Actinomadura barringtoniae TaxID=1427535 RepID=A0A939P9R9_9ACTN|nr:TetR/AcrR family transcriptional regulator [Actinomadura barringtoniae]MBO2448515.1 TetR/AcrR family transcriptional regulator C-terminal domain-containing protein [Actinomadura barringtoniae]
MADRAHLWREEREADPRLSRAEIVQAALALFERDGFESFSMRGLASELNIKSPSLYWHFRSKEELFDLVVDAVLGECRLPADDEGAGAGEWTERLAAAAREIRRVLLANPAATRLLNGRVPLGPNWMRLAEFVIGTLRRAGASDAFANRCYLVFLYYAVGYVTQEIAFGTGAEARERLDEIQEYVRGLPPEQYPNLVAVTAAVTDRGLDERFELGLRGIIGGFKDEL